MTHHNWLVTDQGDRQAFGDPNIPEPERYYRLYRFLTDVEDILNASPSDIDCLGAITPLVRQLLISSYWLQMDYQLPSPDQGWSVHFLYREHDFPLTVQMVCWLPGRTSPIHNHGTWGIVALIGGQERHRLWRRQPHPDYPDRIAPLDEVILNPGDVIALTSDAIHSVEPLGDEPTVSFNLYGEMRGQPRYEFNQQQQTAKRF
jgi:predicted metal-dependent enzyme (double-stranded beta helix superfamily)